VSEAADQGVLASHVRHSDPDRYFAALFAPAPLRAHLFALYAFNHELARVAESVREPMLGEIRLAWWRETLEGAQAGNPRNHDVARALAVVLKAHDLPQALLDALIEARHFDISDTMFPDLAALEAYADTTSGSVMRLAARILGAGEASDALARSAGLAYGLTGLLRAVPHHALRKKLYLPRDLLESERLDPETVFAGHASDALSRVVYAVALRARRHFADARDMRLPKQAAAAFLPAALVPLYLRRLARAGFDPFRLTDVTIHRRQMRLLSASVRGRV
jgi:phytoene synthase